MGLRHGEGEAAGRAGVSGPLRPGPCEAGPSRRRWAERGRETVGPGWARGKREREGKWAGERLGRAEGLGWGFGFGFLFYFFFSSIPNSNKV